MISGGFGKKEWDSRLDGELVAFLLQIESLPHIEKKKLSLEWIASHGLTVSDLEIIMKEIDNAESPYYVTIY